MSRISAILSVRAMIALRKVKQSRTLRDHANLLSRYPYVDEICPRKHDLGLTDPIVPFDLNIFKTGIGYMTIHGFSRSDHPNQARNMRGIRVRHMPLSVEMYVVFSLLSERMRIARERQLGVYEMSEKSSDRQ